jgi:hypothetical protein
VRDTIAVLEMTCEFSRLRTHAQTAGLCDVRVFCDGSNEPEGQPAILQGSEDERESDLILFDVGNLGSQFEHAQGVAKDHQATATVRRNAIEFGTYSCLCYVPTVPAKSLLLYDKINV